MFCSRRFHPVSVYVSVFDYRDLDFERLPFLPKNDRLPYHLEAHPPDQLPVRRHPRYPVCVFRLLLLYFRRVADLPTVKSVMSTYTSFRNSPQFKASVTKSLDPFSADADDSAAVSLGLSSDG